jgi:hypothetical protein
MNEEDIHMIDVEAGIDKKSMDEGSAPVYNIDDDDEEDPKKRGLTSSSRVIELTEEEQRLKRLERECNLRIGFGVSNFSDDEDEEMNGDNH